MGLNMECKIIFSVFVLSANSLFSQSGTTGVAMGQEFDQLASGQTNQKNALTTGAFQSYSSKDVQGSQFFFPGWRKGEVITTHKETFNEGLMFSYDKVRQQLFVRKYDSSLILLTNRDEVQSFTLKDENNLLYNFVNSALFTDERPEVFYQVLIYDSLKLSLLKYIKTTFVKADLTDMMKQREGDVYDAFVDKYTYFIVKGKGTLQTVQLKSKSLKKTFGDQNINIDKYLSYHPGPIDEEYLVELVKSLNE
jgi:hypothetical protein